MPLVKKRAHETGSGAHLAVPQHDSPNEVDQGMGVIKSNGTGKVAKTDPELTRFVCHLGSDIKGILFALQQVRQKAENDSLERAKDVVVCLDTSTDELISQMEDKCLQDRDVAIKAVNKLMKEHENALKEEKSTFEAAYENYCKSRDLHVNTIEEIYHKFDSDIQKLSAKFDHQRKKEKVALTALQNVIAEKITTAQESVKKIKQTEQSMSLLKKSLGSFLDSSDEEDDMP